MKNNFLIIEDTQTNKYLDYEGATDIPIWVTEEDLAHKFTSSDAQIVLDELNVPPNTGRFVGRPGDRGGE